MEFQDLERDEAKAKSRPAKPPAVASARATPLEWASAVGNAAVQRVARTAAANRIQRQEAEEEPDAGGGGEAPAAEAPAAEAEGGGGEAAAPEAEAEEAPE